MRASVPELVCVAILTLTSLAGASAIAASPLAKQVLIPEVPLHVWRPMAAAAGNSGGKARQESTGRSNSQHP